MNQKDIEELAELGKQFIGKFGSITDNLLDNLEKQNPEEAKKARKQVEAMNLNKIVAEAGTELKDVYQKIKDLNGSDSNKG